MLSSALPSCLLVIIWLYVAPLAAQQTLPLDPAATSIVAGGTSTFHDWEMPLQDGRCSGSATFVFDDGSLARLTGLSVQVEAEGLQSNKNGMNKDAYAALKTEEFPYLTFELGEVNKLEKQADGYLVDVSGELSIAGTTRTVDLQATCAVEAGRRITCTGDYTLNMTDYGVEPPKAMLGMVKAGAEVTVTYRVVFGQ